MARLLGRWTPADPEWHEARRTRVGGSEIGVVAGLSPYQTAAELAAQKRGETPRRGDTPATIRGRYLEAAVAEWIEDLEDVIYNYDYAGTFVHDDHDWALFNPDRVTHDGRLVEIKTASEKSPDHGWGRAGTDQIPLTYQAQCMWGLGILGLEDCLIGVCFGQPFEFRRYRMRFNPRVFAHLLTAAERFITDLERKAA